MTSFRTPLKVLAEGENELTASPSGTIQGNLTGNITGGIAGGATQAELNRAADVSTRLVSAGAALSVTELLHDGKTILMDQAAGSTITLPASTGSGAKYRFLQSVVPTSNNNIVRVANGTDVMRGFAMTLQDGGDTAVFFETASTSDTITLNRTTTGGTQIGELIEVEDILAGFFAVRVFNIATGTEATPFSATV